MQQLYSEYIFCVQYELLGIFFLIASKHILDYCKCLSLASPQEIEVVSALNVFVACECQHLIRQFCVFSLLRVAVMPQLPMPKLKLSQLRCDLLKCPD